MVESGLFWEEKGGNLLLQKFNHLWFLGKDTRTHKKTSLWVIIETSFLRVHRTLLQELHGLGHQICKTRARARKHRGPHQGRHLFFSLLLFFFCFSIPCLNPLGTKKGCLFIFCFIKFDQSKKQGFWNVHTRRPFSLLSAFGARRSLSDVTYSETEVL